jgi:hypothetical protein
VRNRRIIATVLVQGLQRMLHRGFVVPILEGGRMGPPKPMVVLLERLPRLTHLTAYVIGVGFRPEHAPDFAVRPRPSP